MNFIWGRKGPSSRDSGEAGRILVALVLMAMIFFGIGFMAVPSVKGSPAELHVGLGQPYKTIQSAVDAAESGDTIVVHSGTYMETVDVTKSNITIRSLLGNPYDVIVDAGGADDHVFDITNQTGVTLTGFTIRNAKGATKDVAGISIYRSTNCKISNNVVMSISAVGYNAAVGIWLYNSSQCDVSNNTVKYSDNGVYLNWYSNRNNFSNTHISSTNVGISLGVYLEHNKFFNTYISNLNANSSVVGIRSDYNYLNEFFNTYIFNLASANGSASGISTWKYFGNNKFSNTYISNIKAKDSAYGIYLWDFKDFFSKTYVFNINGRNEGLILWLESIIGLMPWIGLGLISGIVIAAVIAIRRRKRKPSLTIQKGNASSMA